MLKINFFSGKEKRLGLRPVINQETLNRFMLYMDFKMESLQILKYILEEGD